MDFRTLENLINIVEKNMKQTGVDDGSIDRIYDDIAKIVSVGYDVNMIKSGRQTYDSHRIDAVTKRARSAMQNLNDICKKYDFEPIFPNDDVNDEELYAISVKLRKERSEFYVSKKPDKFDREIYKELDEAEFMKRMDEYVKSNTGRRKEIMREICTERNGALDDFSKIIIDHIDAKETDQTYDALLRSIGRELND